CYFGSSCAMGAVPRCPTSDLAENASIHANSPLRRRALPGGNNVLDGASPAVGGDIKHDAFGRLVLDFIEHIWIFFETSGHVTAPGLFDEAVGMLDIIDPHAEMN